MLKEIQITEQPVSACVPAHHTLTLRCRAEGSLSLQYQWYQRRERCEASCCLIARATQPDLCITARESTLYICRVSDLCNNFQFSRWVKVKVLQNVTKALLPARWHGEPIIVTSPVSSIVNAGTTVTLKCSAMGIPTPDYQWFHNGQLLNHKKTRKLLINAVTLRDSGSYLCCVTNDRGEYWSDPIEITIDTDIAARASLRQQNAIGTPVPDRCYATDKVALLVGNNNYTHHPNLLAPMMDVFEFAILLRQLDFRVVSLLDLTKSEMLTAVSQFLQLLGKGVYGLFYYAGHGYERPGRNYMVPIDAPQPYQPENCISVQKIIRQMQERKTALNVVLLDTCRKWYNPNQYVSEVQPLEPMGNTVYGYATSENAEAYEVQDGEFSSGIFMKYLKEHITKQKKITLVLDNVLEDIGRDPLVAGKQAMEIKHTLIEPRALTDNICTTGHTQEFRARNALWEQSGDLPKQTIKFSCGVEVILTFRAVFSNLMHVHAKLNLVPPGVTDTRILLYAQSEMADLFKLNTSRSHRVNRLLDSASDREVSDCMLRLCELQKCQNDVIIQIDLHYTRMDIRQRAHESLHHNLKRPLIAKLFTRESSAAASSSSFEAASSSATVAPSSAAAASCHATMPSSSATAAFSSASGDHQDVSIGPKGILYPPPLTMDLSYPGTSGACPCPNLLCTSHSKLGSDPEENDEGDTLALPVAWQDKNSTW